MFVTDGQVQEWLKRPVLKRHWGFQEYSLPKICDEQVGWRFLKEGILYPESLLRFGKNDRLAPILFVANPGRTGYT